MSKILIFISFMLEAILFYNAQAWLLFGFAMFGAGVSAAHAWCHLEHDNLKP